MPAPSPRGRSGDSAGTVTVTASCAESAKGPGSLALSGSGWLSAGPPAAAAPGPCRRAVTAVCARRGAGSLVRRPTQLYLMPLS